MADGGVRIDVGLNTSKAEKDLARLKDQIKSAESDLNSKSSNANALEEQMQAMETAVANQKAYIEDLKASIQEMQDMWNGEEYSLKGNDLSFEEFSELPNDIARAKEELADAEKLLKEQEKSAAKIGAEYAKAADALEKENAKLGEMQAKADQLEGSVVQSRFGEGLAGAFDGAKKSLGKFVKYALGIGSVLVLFNKLRSYIKSAITEFASVDDETKASIEGLKTSLATLKMSWGAAFAPIFNAIVPILQTLIGWLTAAANAVARFIALLSGQSTYKKAIANNNALADSLGGAGAAAEEAKKQILGFDEINQLSDDSSGGGGGGGGSGSGYDLIEEALDIRDGSFLSDLALTVQDVLFDWDDLNPEQIAQKAITGLAMLLGGATGFMIAGVPGAIVGTLLGLTLALVANAAIFDHDGVLDSNEVASMIRIALNGLIGGVVGFVIGGPGGALIGATIGVGFTLLAKGIIPRIEDVKTQEFLSALVDGLNAGILGGAGAALGFVLGGPGGAVLGAVIGLGLSFVIGKVEALDGEGSTRSQYKDTMSWFLCGVLGLPTDEEWKKYAWDAINWFGEGFLDFTDELHNLIAGPMEQLVQVDIPETLAWFKQMGPKIVEWIGDGFFGFTDELHWIIADPIERFIDWLLNWWDNIKLSPFHIPHPVFEWSYSEAGGLIAKAMEFVGIPPMIPHLNISWMARGGIFDNPSLIGVGEAGKEAVVPLERNTEWIGMVADGLLDRFKQSDFMNDFASAFASVPLPAMAGGGIVPPRSIGSGSVFSDSDLSRIAEAISGALSGSISEDIKIGVYLDGRELSDAVTKWQKRSSRGMGV